MARDAALTAVNRFGLGARPGELADATSDPRGWLLAQLGAGAEVLPDALPNSLDYLRQETTVRDLRKMAKASNGEMMAQQAAKDAEQELRKRIRQEIALRQQVAVVTARSFPERIVRFWSNHFAISTDKNIAASFAAPMEREAIRPHAFGKFSDLLVAIETHPGMLLYLDNTQSIGVDSKAGMRARKAPNPKAARRGLNENLAREILELHTLGVNGGYAQADVIELAKGITGWSLQRPQDLSNSGAPFYFNPNTHEPGDRRVLGKRYREEGEAQGRAILADLALHPATAQHLSLKLARHFVADQPPPQLVTAMAQAYLASGGDLAALYSTMVRHPLAWAPTARKFKTPQDFLVSSMRALTLDTQKDAARTLDLQARMGHPVFQPRSPAGFADTAADWSGPDALYKRVQAAQTLADAAPQSASNDPMQLATHALGDGMDAETLTAVRRAESPRQGVALLLASPSFQWRV
ncbi:DUF1800 domain-containing protein [Solilutibacter silvestris]|uniref:DUF1800 domain-containing protein n=1 Tax=Solilutibacter silvestris TaxID=1645665 RepID=A0A2K1Q3A5_9GAMM|nr:DUF1800 domain-containing protein [Lysobacter silvestris]PNS09532.1 hypothetical protein Lysil_1161 [Lysobacter silvestris]